MFITGDVRQIIYKENDFGEEDKFFIPTAG